MSRFTAQDLNNDWSIDIWLEWMSKPWMGAISKEVMNGGDMADAVDNEEFLCVAPEQGTRQSRNWQPLFWQVTCEITMVLKNF